LLAFSFAFAQEEYVPGEFIVKLKGKSSSTASAGFMGKVHGKMDLKMSLQGLNLHKFSLKSGQNFKATLDELKADPDVEYAEPNYILRKMEDQYDAGLNSAAYTSVDVHGMIPAAGTGFIQNYAAVGADAAWAQAKTLVQNPDRPIVAVIDSGVDYNHEIFQNSGAMWINSGEIPGNGIDDDGNGYIDDVYGYNFHDRTSNPMDDNEHGTHVAGIILGATRDIFGANSTAKVRIMALKFLGSDGSGSTSDAVSAIYYAVRNGAQVINNSWGGSSYSQALHDAIAYAYDNRVFISTAAGNYTKNNDSNDFYPANYPVPGQMSVAATTDSDALAGFSNYGATKVHIASPGSYILSSVPGNQYKYMSGTSMAAPFVAGIAAMVMREAPNLTGYQVKNVLINSSTIVAGLTNKVSSRGRVDVYDAVMAGKNEVGSSAFQPSYKAEYRAPASSGSADASGGGPKGCGTVSTILSQGFSGKDGDGGGSTSQMLFVLALTLIPLLAWQVLRSRAEQSGASRRKFERFKMDSDIKVQVGGRELVGHMHTISEGGLSFKAEEMLEKGGILSIQIQSPDGKESVQVQGHIVWSEQNQAYGVQFDNAKDSVRDHIRAWTNRLAKVGADS
jgi:subtilisin family serine protease